MRRYLPFIIVAAIGLIALGTATMLFRAKRATLRATPENSTAAADETGASIRVRGDAKAPVTIEEFGDFQCPPCAKLAGPMKQLEKLYGSQMRVIFRQFPLAMHPHAYPAALAAEAAGFQGRFWEMHDLLYREQASWSKSQDVRALFNGYAGMLGLNLDRFKTDMDSPAAKERVASDQKRAGELGITTTPTVFVNGRKVPAPVELPGLHAAIEAALAPPPSTTTPPTPAP